MTTLYDNVVANQYYPVGIQRVILDQLTNDGTPIVDNTNPVMFTLNAAASLASLNLEKYEAVLRRQYPSLAQTEDDLYYHMSDVDYLNRFAAPSTITVMMALDKAEILSKLVEDPLTGIKKLVIPRNTTITVSDTVFSLQYPIEIQQLRHGGLSIIYNTDQAAPDYILPTNIVSYYEATVNNVDWLTLELYLHQFSVVTVKETISAASPVKVQVPIADSFYYARVYLEQNDGSWAEITTTHSQLTYDVTKPTAVMHVSGNVLTVTIPQIYINAGLALSAIRVDLYQTKGGLNMDLSAYPTDAFTVTWLNLDSNDDTVYTAPMKNLQTVKVWSDQLTAGGRDVLAFDELRNRIINHSVGVQELPITPSQISTALEDDSYTIVKNVDTLTDRVFLATRSLPTPTNASLITAAAIGVQDLITSFKDALLLDTVINNDTSITITPDTIYQNNGGQTSFLSSAKKASLLAMPADKRAPAVSGGKYYYSPFHYVLDTQNSEFDVRPYFLTKPSLVYKSFVEENDSTELQVAIDAVSLDKTSNGYSLTLLTASSTEFQAVASSELFVQLSYIPQGEKVRAFVNGVLDGVTEAGERLYRFDLTSTHYVNGSDNIELLPFAMFDGTAVSTFSPLTNTFDVVFATSSAMPTAWVPNTVDTLLGKDLLPETIAGIAHEKLNLRFGYAMESLWTQCRTLVSALDYETYPATVYETYTEDVYVRDPVTKSAVQIVDGQITYQILHHKGDFILDANGNQIVKYNQGDTIIAPETGEPIVKNPRGVSRQFSLALIEGAYYFANDSVAVDYRDEIANTLVNWIVNDMEDINQRLLDKTAIYFYPKSTLGNIQAVADNSRVVLMNAGQAFTLALYVSKAVYEDDKLKEQLEKRTIEVLSAQLQQATISMTSIIEALKLAYGSDVIEFTITGLENGAYRVVSMVSDATRCSIRKRVTAQGDSSLIVEEDVTFNYYKHTTE